MGGKTVDDGRELYRSRRSSKSSDVVDSLPSAETAFGRGHLLALAVSSGTEDTVRRAARKALEDWQISQNSEDVE